MSKYTVTVINPVKLYYGDKEFTIGSLDLKPEYALALYRLVRFKRHDGVLDDITFEEITSIRTIGDTKARAIVKALSKIGVEVKNVPEIVVPTRMDPWFDHRGAGYKCSNCSSTFHSVFNADDDLFKHCPMCGKKLTW